MIILGINAHHPDSAACLMQDGRVIAAVEEERFTRVKHWMGVPIQSIHWCLQEAKVPLSAVDHIAINRRPWANLRFSDLFTLKGRGQSIASIGSLRTDLSQAFDCMLTAPIHHVEHHLAHAASAFFFSPYPQSAILTVDGMGDLCSTMWAMGKDNRITVQQRVKSPHSLGILYTAITQYLGFQHYGDEYKVMALAAMGTPAAIHEMQSRVTLLHHGRFALELNHFTHHLSGSVLRQKDGHPELTQLFRLHPPLLDTHTKEDIAFALQTVYQRLLVYLSAYCPSKYLCLAGGCAQNTVANGYLLKYFDGIYIPPAPADNGGAIGAAAYVWCQKLGRPRPEPMEHALYGCHQEVVSDAPSYSRADLIARTVRHLINGKLVGWFQGPMEFGPRALGNRSIVADPRRSDLKDKLNGIVKHREAWRPFGMSILRDHVLDYFTQDVESPFMSFTLPVKEEKRKEIPAVVHVDGSSRLQTVTRKQNPLFWELLMEFYKHTGVPLLLNTSFNDQAPIVRTQAEAYDVFQTTELDVLVAGRYVWKK